MTAVQDYVLKDDFQNIYEKALEGEVVVISRPDSDNVVLISERNYTELEKYKNNAEYLAKIDRAIAQKEAGTMKEHDIIED